VSLVLLSLGDEGGFLQQKLSDLLVDATFSFEIGLELLVMMVVK